MSDDVTLLEQHQYTDYRVREKSAQFHREENGAWRRVHTAEIMPKLGVGMNNLASGPPIQRRREVTTYEGLSGWPEMIDWRSR